MIENRRGLTIFSHTMLILGIMVILFPLYVAFVAATLDNKAVFETPMTLIPAASAGQHENHLGKRRGRQQRAVLADDAQQLHHGVRHYGGKITVSMLSAFRHRLVPLSAA
jgi:sn-glycerol 3-phosphate transport system permease protein